MKENLEAGDLPTPEKVTSHVIKLRGFL